MSSECFGQKMLFLKRYFEQLVAIDCTAFVPSVSLLDLFPPCVDLMMPAVIYIFRCDIVHYLVAEFVVEVVHKVSDLLLQLPRQIVFLKIDIVLHRAMMPPKTLRGWVKDEFRMPSEMISKPTTLFELLNQRTTKRSFT